MKRRRGLALVLVLVLAAGVVVAIVLGTRSPSTRTNDAAVIAAGAATVATGSLTPLA